MCGFFAGVFDRAAAPGPDRVAAALDAIGHRGPDGRGAVRLDLPRGREVLIHSGSRPDLVIAPVAVGEPGAAWGLP